MAYIKMHVIFSVLKLIDVRSAVPENIHTPLMEGFFVLHPRLPENSSLASYIASEILNCKTPPPPPLGISNDLPWSGYEFFFWNCAFFWYKLWEFG